MLEASRTYEKKQVISVTRPGHETIAKVELQPLDRLTITCAVNGKEVTTYEYEAYDEAQLTRDAANIETAHLVLMVRPELKSNEVMEPIENREADNG